MINIQNKNYDEMEAKNCSKLNNGQPDEEKHKVKKTWQCGKMQN